MRLKLDKYTEQLAKWPSNGKHIMAHYDSDSIVVYQAYRPSIGNYAAQNGHFGGDFSYSRMSWIKPNFLWMMYRSGWGQKQGQEVILAVKISREGFDQILQNAVISSYDPVVYDSKYDWQSAVSQSNVRLQWDPDHDPYGGKVERRAIQLGLRNDILEQYGRDWILSIDDISDFVREQYGFVKSKSLDKLIIPKENVYPINGDLQKKLGMLN